jgi:hypothetical protein
MDGLRHIKSSLGRGFLGENGGLRDVELQGSVKCVRRTPVLQLIFVFLGTHFCKAHLLTYNVIDVFLFAIK